MKRRRRRKSFRIMRRNSRENFLPFQFHSQVHRSWVDHLTIFFRCCRNKKSEVFFTANALFRCWKSCGISYLNFLKFSNLYSNKKNILTTIINKVARIKKANKEIKNVWIEKKKKSTLSSLKWEEMKKGSQRH